MKWHVVGVNEAPTSQMLPPLKHAESDAQAVATLLTQRKCGFALHERVFLGEDATASTVMDALSDLADELGQDDLLMVYFYDHEQPMLIEAERKDVYLVTHDLNERRAKKR